MAISALTAAISGAFEGIGTGLWATGVDAQLGSASGDDLVLAGSSEYGDLVRGWFERCVSITRHG